MKVGANEPCPCGSGKKYKKCCRDKLAAERYSREDRLTLLAKLDDFIHEHRRDEFRVGFGELWGDLLEGLTSMPADIAAISSDVLRSWFIFDREDDGGETPFESFAVHALLTSGERAFLTTLHRSTMRLYEVADVVPGVSLTLRDVIEGGDVKVNERTASRQVDRHTWLAARVVPHGPSAGPEMEGGVLEIPRLLRENVREQMTEHRRAFLRKRPGDVDGFYRTMPPFFHHVWAGAILDPMVPELRSADGDETVFTRVRFDVLDEAALATVLAAHPDVTPTGAGEGIWQGMNKKGERVRLGRITLADDGLTLETDSVERAGRGRALLESFGERTLRHRVTTHENVRRAVKERIRARNLSGEADDAERAGPAEIPREIADALVLGHYARHYRGWIDEPVPALDGKTPREGATDRKLRARTIDLIRGLEGLYQRALRSGAPAYDPSWMWSELGLVDRDAASHPPPLAHERVAAQVPGSGELSREVAERLRRAPGFDDTTSSLSQQAFDRDLDVQRFLRAGRPSANDSGGEGALAAPYLRLMINFDLHRRKAFWVDEPVAYMLGHTDVDVRGDELRVPFASFAIVFTDRYVLSFAERLLAARLGSPLAGQILKVVTAYVTEERDGDARALEIVFALDALGADLPELVRHEIPLGDDEPASRYLDAVAPLPQIDPPPPDTNPARGLLRATLNAILYATSARVEPVVRASAKKERAAHTPMSFASDEIYSLPGAIDIRLVRRMQELERAPEGGVMLRRFIVRGHWRRAPQNWADKRLRWIEPHWKGPDMAAIIERAYRLKE